jgi:hypothetical protein
MATTAATVELSTQQLADRLGVSSRMVNIYRAEAERLAGKRLGTKRGKTTYFNADDQVWILKVKNQGVDVEGVRSHHQEDRQQQAQNFTATTNQTEEGILSGMDGLVQAGDRNAIQIGQALGQRWNQMVITSALSSMQQGMISFQSQFEELNAGIAFAASPIQPQLTGSDPKAPRLDFLESVE